jgi:hypothetical protein
MNESERKKRLKDGIISAIAENALSFLDGQSPDDIGVSEEEIKMLQKHIEKFAYKISKNHPLNLGSSTAHILYSLNK